MLESGLYDIPRGHVATVVTTLEMLAPAPPRPATLPPGVSIEAAPAPDAAWYRDLFARVGGHDWLWFSRLVMETEELTPILNDPRIEIWTVRRDGQAEGLAELDFREDGVCELAFFGLTRALIGSGTGRALMTHAIARAWAQPISRFWVHTCTLDSPAALDFYRRSGFAAICQQIEVAPDPRLTGNLPRGAAPQVPIFE